MRAAWLPQRSPPSATLCDMAFGKEPRRRRWSSDSSRRKDEADDAEDWLAGYRPDPEGEPEPIERPERARRRTPTAAEPLAPSVEPTGRRGPRADAETALSPVAESPRPRSDVSVAETTTFSSPPALAPSATVEPAGRPRSRPAAPAPYDGEPPRPFGEAPRTLDDEPSRPLDDEPARPRRPRPTVGGLLRRRGGAERPEPDSGGSRRSRRAAGPGPVDAVDPTGGDAAGGDAAHPGGAGPARAAQAGSSWAERWRRAGPSSDDYPGRRRRRAAQEPDAGHPQSAPAQPQFPPSPPAPTPRGRRRAAADDDVEYTGRRHRDDEPVRHDPDLQRGATPLPPFTPPAPPSIPGIPDGPVPTPQWSAETPPLSGTAQRDNVGGRHDAPYRAADDIRPEPGDARTPADPPRRGRGPAGPELEETAGGRRRRDEGPAETAVVAPAPRNAPEPRDEHRPRNRREPRDGPAPRRAAERADPTDAPAPSGRASGAIRRPGSGAALPPRIELTAGRRSRIWLGTLIFVSVVVLLGVCGLSAFFMIDEAGTGTPSSQDASASGSPTIVARDISSQAADPEPLTVQEVFPQQQIATTTGGEPYEILKTQAEIDCHVTATDELGTTFVQLGCSQVVQATMRSPDGKHLVTAGIFNLRDEASAEKAHQAIPPALAANQGRFQGLPAGNGTEAIRRAPTHISRVVRGHFLAFCIIARTDMAAIPTDDPTAQQITKDIVEAYLRDTVIAARAVYIPSSESASPGASPAPS